MASRVTMTAAAPSLLSPAQDLLARLERTIHCRTGGRISDLRVESINEGIVLSGRAPTYYAKQLATHAALTELEAQELTNEIEVL
ncbi:MAG: BON domain-containing protein [Planctomycetaceae bacterium]|nr:BON domain-containing protein [Planctomycetaceae bacterium]